jgi:hypothetical protein
MLTIRITGSHAFVVMSRLTHFSQFDSCAKCPVAIGRTRNSRSWTEANSGR